MSKYTDCWDFLRSPAMKWKMGMAVSLLLLYIGAAGLWIVSSFKQAQQAEAVAKAAAKVEAVTTIVPMCASSSAPVSAERDAVHIICGSAATSGWYQICRMVPGQIRAEHVGECVEIGQQTYRILSVSAGEGTILLGEIPPPGSENLWTVREAEGHRK